MGLMGFLHGPPRVGVQGTGPCVFRQPEMHGLPGLVSHRCVSLAPRGLGVLGPLEAMVALVLEARVAADAEGLAVQREEKALTGLVGRPPGSALLCDAGVHRRPDGTCVASGRRGGGGDRRCSLGSKPAHCPPPVWRASGPWMIALRWRPPHRRRS